MSPTPNTTDDLRDKVWNGGKVTLKQWAEAREREEATERTDAIADEYAALIAQGEQIATGKAERAALEADVANFTRDKIGALQDAYANYVNSRRELVSLLQNYEDKRRPLVVRTGTPGLEGIEPPPPLTWHAMLHVADVECQGGPVAPHVLHKPAE